MTNDIFLVFYQKLKKIIALPSPTYYFFVLKKKGPFLKLMNLLTVLGLFMPGVLTMRQWDLCPLTTGQTTPCIELSQSTGLSGELLFLFKSHITFNIPLAYLLFTVSVFT